MTARSSKKNMKKYEILKHRADLRLKIFGKHKQNLFENALFGMSENMRPEFQETSEKITRAIKIKSIDIAALLVDFLSEALYLSQANKEAYLGTSFSKISDTELIGELLGQKVESFGEDIKAVTHHDLAIKQNKSGWEAKILFDI